MRTTILFLTMMTMIFVISPCTTHAQEDQCFPGLEQIPPYANEDWFDISKFATGGNLIYGSQIISEKTGSVISIVIVRGWSSGSQDVKVCFYGNANNSPQQALTEVNPTSTTIPSTATPVQTVSTFTLNLAESFNISAGDTLWVCIKQNGAPSDNFSRRLRQFPDAEGLRFMVANDFNSFFPESLSAMPSGNITNGLYGIYLIMENCEDPPVPVEGCTDENAFNFNPDATINDGSCIFPILGCTNEEAFNFNPDAELDDGSCVLEITCSDVPLCLRTDANQDETVTVIDILIFLAMFGTSPQELETSNWCTGILLDLNNDGILNAEDLSIFLTCFGLDLSDDWEAFWNSLNE